MAVKLCTRGGVGGVDGDREHGEGPKGSEEEDAACEQVGQWCLQTRNCPSSQDEVGRRARAGDQGGKGVVHGS